MWGETPEAFQVLKDLMKPGVAEGIRLKAATEMLDRAGLKAGQEIAVTVEHVGSPMDDILTQLQIIGGHVDPNRDLEVLDAEEGDDIDES
jgi:phage-related minor tail protein